MDFEKARFNMVEQQIRPWDVLDFDVLDALEEIPRERFVSESLQGLAYADMELPLANGHKMLEPKIVARLAQGLKLTKTDTVLEIGTGSGYATALLAKLAGKVVSDDLDAEHRVVAVRGVLVGDQGLGAHDQGDVGVLGVALYHFAGTVLDDQVVVLGIGDVELEHQVQAGSGAGVRQ